MQKYFPKRLDSNVVLCYTKTIARALRPGFRYIGNLRCQTCSRGIKEPLRIMRSEHIHNGATLLEIKPKGLQDYRVSDVSDQAPSSGSVFILRAFPANSFYGSRI